MPENKNINQAKFAIGQLVRHRVFPFRGVIFDVDPEFSNSEEWYESIPDDIRPRRDQPFYHLFAENDHIFYIAYVSEQNLLHDDSEDLPKHPEIQNLFSHFEDGKFMPTARAIN